MNILYLHGFNSYFSLESEKLQELKKITNRITGFSIRYENSFSEIVDSVCSFIEQDNEKCGEGSKIDLLVGTSLGGWLASHVSKRTKIPAVLINPSTNPAETLKKYIGENVTYDGRKYILLQNNISEFPPIETDLNNNGLCLLDRGDEVTDANVTYELLNPYYTMVTYQGGDHRFQHMKDSLRIIELFYELNYLSVGF